MVSTSRSKDDLVEKLTEAFEEGELSSNESTAEARASQKLGVQGENKGEQSVGAVGARCEAGSEEPVE